MLLARFDFVRNLPEGDAFGLQALGAQPATLAEGTHAFDEPTSALDYDARENFIRLLFAECREAGSSLLFVSHDQSLAPLFDRHLSLAELNRTATSAEV